MCNQTEESIGAVETVLQNYRNEDQDENENQDNDNGNGNSSISDKNIPIIVCLNKMDSNKFTEESLKKR